MNKFIAQIINKIAFTFRVLQFLLMAQLALGFIYWILVLGNFTSAIFFAPLYTLPVNIVKGFAQLINWNIGEKFTMLHPDIFCALFVILIALFISNLLFVGFGELEKKYVEQSYDSGERDYK